MKSLIELNSCQEIKNIFESLQPAICTRILNSTSSGCTILYLAVKKRRYQISCYLIHLSLRQGHREMCEAWKKSRHPLSAAIDTNDMRLIELIARNLFDINEYFYGSYTPLTLAASTGEIRYVTLMLRLGADIDVPDVDGTSPLMTCTFNLTLSRFLITHNANINHQDLDGDTALHLAVVEKSSPYLRCLVINGADMNIRNRNGLTPLLLASAHLNIMAFTFLCQQDAYSQPEKIEALEVLGACCVCAQVQGINYWNRALRLRSNIYPKTGHSFPTHDIFNSATEFTTSSELERLQHYPLLLAFQGILVIERILGRDNCVYLNCLLKTALIAKIVLVSTTFRRLINYIKNICLTASARSIAACGESFKILFDRIANDGQESLFKKGGFVIFKLIANAAGKIRLSSQCSNQPFYEKVPFSNIVDLLLYIMSRINKIYLSKEYRRKFTEVVEIVVRTDPRVKNKQSLLHRVIKFHGIKNWCSLKLIQLLIDCGADVDSQDYFNRTPFEYARKLGHKRSQKILYLLAEKRSHLGCMNDYIVSTIKKTDSVYLPLYYEGMLSLKCLSAQVIVNYEIPYKEYLPLLLVKFVELHI